MPRRQAIPVISSLALGAAAGALSYLYVPRLTEPVRTNIIGPEMRTLEVPRTDGSSFAVEVEILARAESRSVFAIESPYSRTTTAGVRLIDPQRAPADLDIDALNDAVSASLLERTDGSWGMEFIEIPRFDPSGPPTRASTATRQWLVPGILDNGARLMGIALGATALSYSVIFVVGRTIRRSPQPGHSSSGL